MLDLCAKVIPHAEREDVAMQCNMLAPMVTKFTMCFRKPLSKLSQCTLKMVAHSTQTSGSRRVKATVQQMRSPTETEGPVTSAYKYECVHCKKCFTVKSHLVRHLLIHTGERPFHCDRCNRRFAQKSNLMVHMSAHTGERPYCCDYCDRAYIGKCRLAVHIRTHTGEKPYQCQMCPMAFPAKCSLTRHVRSHKGEKPFQCDVCPKAFANRRNFQHHKETNHKKCTLP